MDTGSCMECCICFIKSGKEWYMVVGSVFVTFLPCFLIIILRYLCIIFVSSTSNVLEVVYL